MRKALDGNLERLVRTANTSQVRQPFALVSKEPSGRDRATYSWNIAVTNVDTTESMLTGHGVWQNVHSSGVMSWSRSCWQTSMQSAGFQHDLSLVMWRGNSIKPNQSTEMVVKSPPDRRAATPQTATRKDQS